MKNTTLIFASHNMVKPRTFVRIILARSGKIVDQGKPDEITKQYGKSNLKEVFFKNGKIMIYNTRIKHFFKTHIFDKRFSSKNYRFNLLANNTDYIMGLYIKVFFN